MFGSVAGGDDRSSFRTLGVGRRILDAGYKSIPVSHVAAVTIYRPSRFSFLKLFFALCCVVAGALVGLFVFVPPTLYVPVGAGAGLLVGLLAFIPSRPTCLLISASDGSGAVFESRDVTFLRQCKGFIDAKINESRLDATGFFDFETSRFEPLADGRMRPSAPRSPAPVDGSGEAGMPLPAGRVTEGPAEPAAAVAPEVSLPEPPPEPPQAAPDVTVPPVEQPSPGAAPHAAAHNENSVPAGRDPALTLQNDGYDALRNALMAAGGTPPASETEAQPPAERQAPPQAPSQPANAPASPQPSQSPSQPPSQPMPPLDFGNAMAQVQQVRRFYEETVQNPGMVQRLDVMVEIMHSGAGNERDRADLILIAEEIESNLTTYPSIAAIFRRVADQARTGVAA